MPSLLFTCQTDLNETNLKPPIQDHCDYVDLNLGCPQRIAKKGFYGAFLMDNLDLVEKLVIRTATALKVPVSCKIRLFPDPEKTLAYARMLERAGCSLLAVHGRTRDMKVPLGRLVGWLDVGWSALLDACLADA
jgi:tRNA-dihydrouridine synthase